MTAYARPSDLHEALGLLSDRPHRILAGGTDVYPADAAAVGWGRPGLDHPDSPPVLDITGIDTLRGIRRFPDRVELGALVTWTDAIEADLPAWFDCVRLAAREVGGRQIQNRGTVAGNLCNASPAADGVPALLVLNACVRLQHRSGSREVPLHAFITGNRRTCLQPGELMTAIVIPSPASAARSTFLKLGARRYLVISIAMVAACLDVKDGRIRGARLAVGACSEVAQRLEDLEARLEGVSVTEAPAIVRDEDLASLAPLDDVRASAPYRLHGARVLVRRALDGLARGDGPAGGGIRVPSTSSRGNSKAKSLDSRLRGNDGRGPSGRRRADYHSRLRGNDGIDAVARRVLRSRVRDWQTPMDSRLRGNDGKGAKDVIPAKAGTIVRTAQAGTPPTVIPAKAGIHAASPEHDRALAGTASNFPAEQCGQVP